MRDKIINWLFASSKRIAFVFLIFSSILFLITFGSVKQKRLHLVEGQPVEETIRANKTIENVKETANKKKLAQEAVAPEYNYQPEIKDTQIGYIEKLFTWINEVNKEAQEKFEKDQKDAKDSKEAQEILPVKSEEKVAALKQKFETADENALAFYQGLPTAFFTDIFQLNEGDIQKIEKETVTILADQLAKHIRESNLSDVKQDAIFSLQLTDLSASLQQEVRFLLNQGVVPNEFYNEKKTEELKKEAGDAVPPVMIYQGEIIVREGNQLDSKAMNKLELLGMTKQSTSIFPIVSLIFTLILQSAILWYYVKDHEQKEKRWLIGFYCSLMFLSVLLMKVFKLFQTEQLSFIPQLFPVAFVPLVLTIFCTRRLGMLAAVFQSLFVYYLYFDAVGTTYLAALVAVYLFNGTMSTMVSRKRLGYQTGKAFVWIILFPLCFNLIMVTYQGMAVFESTTIMTLLCGLVGSGLAYLLSVGLHPYLELLLTDDSDIVLNELSNPNHPLLKELLEKAPGTYHHSMMVANLSANAVAEIGGRSLLTRVACYYHDIGKLKNPNFFVENLPIGAENPHNFLLPEDSKKIIFSHVTEGVKILESYKMPQMIIDICWQHHGTTLMRFFYVKAKERNPEVTEADFRYPGPKPQTREAAVVSIADSCEAAIRAMDQPTPKKMADFVHNLIISRLTDGQLDECGLTMKELKIIEKSIISGLGSTFHSRIKYPSLNTEEEQK